MSQTQALSNEPPSRASQGPTGSSSDERIAEEVLRTIRSLMEELNPRRARRVTVRLDSDLDRDLALDSLARAELLLRLDRLFKVRLPDRVIADADRPGDLVAAVRAAHPQTPARRDRPAARPTLPQTAEPTAAMTLGEVLTAGSRAHGERPHIYLRRGPDDEETITYTELERAARAVAGGLVERRLRPGERIGIMLPTERGFFHAFFGVLFAGGIPVPIYPPFRRAQVEDHLRRQAGILRNAEASMLITNEEIGITAGLLRGLVGSLREIAPIARLSRSEAIPAPLPSTPDTTALIQYTSGSTGDPKGVVLSHANLLANIRALGSALGASSFDTVVSWLPLYHDMGLIGCWLGSLYFGAPVAIMSPLSFLADPARWLWAVHAHRATLTAGPNFAFELCLKSIRDGDIEGLDLSSLRAVMNGAEPVSPSTLKRFAERFARYGFRAQAMTPVYGLAESSVGLAFPPIGRGPIIDRIDRHALTTQGVAGPAKPDDGKALEFVACGQPLPGHEIRIVDDSGHELPDRHEGRLQFKGPSTTSGYFHNPEKTRELFSGDWLESGDRAYIAAGDVFVTGRIKDILSAVAVPLWLSVVVLPFRRWRHAALGVTARLFFRLTGTPLEVASDTDVPRNRVILVANHASYLDAAVLYAACGGPLTFVAKVELASQRIAGPLLRRLGTVFVRSDAAGGVGDTQAILDVVRIGEPVAWFPEGTFTRMPGLLSFHLGAFVIAAQTGVPVVPVTITGTRSMLRADQWLPRRGAIFVHIGQPLTADGDDFEAALRLRDRVRQEILVRCGEPDLSEERVSFE